MGIIKIL